MRAAIKTRRSWVSEYVLEGRFGLLLQTPVRTVTVKVPDVLGQDRAEMPLAEDQPVVQAPAAQCSHEPLGE